MSLLDYLALSVLRPVLACCSRVLDAEARASLAADLEREAADISGKPGFDGADGRLAAPYLRAFARALSHSEGR